MRIVNISPTDESDVAFVVVLNNWQSAIKMKSNIYYCPLFCYCVSLFVSFCTCCSYFWNALPEGLVGSCSTYSLFDIWSSVFESTSLQLLSLQEWLVFLLFSFGIQSHICWVFCVMCSWNSILITSNLNLSFFHRLLTFKTFCLSVVQSYSQTLRLKTGNFPRCLSSVYVFSVMKSNELF